MPCKCPPLKNTFLNIWVEIKCLLVFIYIYKLLIISICCNNVKCFYFLIDFFAINLIMFTYLKSLPPVTQMKWPRLLCLSRAFSLVSLLHIVSVEVDCQSEGLTLLTICYVSKKNTIGITCY